MRGVPVEADQKTAGRFPPLALYFRPRAISIVIRLFREFKFVDPVKNSVDPRRNEFAI